MDKTRLTTIGVVLEKSGLAQLFRHHTPPHTLHRLVKNTLEEPYELIHETIEIIHVLLQLSPELLFAKPEDFYNETVLLCSRVHIDILKFLIDQGAELMPSDDGNDSFVHRASEYLDPDQFHDLVAHLLIKGKGAVLNSRNRNSATPLHKAARNLHLKRETINLLISAGSSLNDEDDMGATVLVYAIRGGGNYDYLSMLVALGADWKKLDTTGNNVVHSATDYGNHEAVKYFVTLGIDPNAKNGDGCTPIHYALRWGIRNTHEVVQALVELGGDVNIKDNEGHSALWYTQNGWKRVEEKTRELILSKIIQQDPAANQTPGNGTTSN